MRCLVTGSTGFIGSNLVARLRQEGHTVYGVDVKQTPERAHLYEQAHVHFTIDLRKDVPPAMRSVDWVFHLAADHGGAGYFHGPADFKAAMNNEAIDRRILQSAMDFNVGRLFFASSACTYPTTIQGTNAKPLKESDWGGGPAEALYGERKRMSTLFFEGARDHGLDARSGIFHTIYGPGQDWQEPRAKFPTAICRKLVEDPKRVEIWGDGTQVRSFLYIEDALDRIIALTAADEYEGPVNIGSDESVTVQQCAEWAADAAGVDPEWVYVDGPRGVDERSADNSEWNRRFGETQLLPARKGFEETYRYLANVAA